MPDAPQSKAEAMEALRERKGQSYLLADEAFNILGQFGTDVTPEFAIERGELVDEDDISEGSVTEWVGRHALSCAVGDEQRATRNARGILNTWAHQMVLTVADVSDILVEALGGEPAEGSGAGAGFYADSKHDGNISRLDKLLFEGDPDPAEA